MTDDDRALINRIMETEGLVMADLIQQYWRDLDRAERTPRMLLYLHLGLLAGLHAKAEDQLRQIYAALGVNNFWEAMNEIETRH